MSTSTKPGFAQQETDLAGREALRATWSSVLKLHGRRVTKQRMALMEAAAGHPHGTAEALHATACKVEGRLALPTAHVILKDLCDVGLLRRIDVPGSPALYETEQGDNHHHVQCTECGRIEDVPCAAGHAPCLTPATNHGMTIHRADVLYRGTCASCVAEAPAEQEQP